ncbi:MAG: cellulase family glycosylhydrolase [Acidobacteriia bacterium]|nr:cellulase family glycosylhydrolase [Terriglobia bacterium]
MCKRIFYPLAWWLALAAPLAAHAPPIYVPVPPVHVNGNRLVDSANVPFLLRGVEMPGLEVAVPAQPDLDAVRAMTSLTFRIIQQRWNMNAVRLPVSVPVWRRDGQAYLDRIAAIVAAANQERLVVFLAAYADARAGATADSGLPDSGAADFWKACAASFKNAPGVIFSLYNQPSTRSIPGASAGVHRAADWTVWRNGGALSGGQTAVGMQALVDAIRAAGAPQVIAVPSFHDSLDFQGFGPDVSIKDANILYEAHPFYDQGVTEDAWNANYGFMGASFPVYAGAWGMPLGQASAACSAVPTDPSQASDLLFRNFAWFDQHIVSWTAADFAPGSLIQNFTDFTATNLNQPWTCDGSGGGQTGIGQFMLLQGTGDPAGFGSIDPTQIASVAGGAPAPVAPGEILAIFGQLIGPVNSVGAQVDATGQVARLLSDTQVFFDGIAAPVFLTGYFQVNVQVPYEVAGKTTVVQLVYRGVPSAKIQLPVTAASPGILTHLGTNDAAALNQDATPNGFSNPADRGAIVSLFATGSGATLPASPTGVLAQFPLAACALEVAVSIGGRPAGILYSGAAPGLDGVMQINARIPADIPLDAIPQRVPVVLKVGDFASRDGVTFWLK